MQYIILYTFLFAGLFGDSVVTINNKSYTINDFYQEYGKKEWDDAKKNQQKELINDFINKRIAALEGTVIGLNNKPDITKKLYDRNHSALVSTTYEELVAKPLISEQTLVNTKKYIVEERLLSHILIAYDSARTQNPVSRSIDDAFLLARQIKKDLDNGANFIDQAIKYSEDPTVFQNEGKLDWITWGRTIPAFQNEAFLLKKGEYSHPVLTDFGYHVIFCEDIRSSKYASLGKEELEDVIYIVARNSISGHLAQWPEEVELFLLEEALVETVYIQMFFLSLLIFY